MNKLQKQPSIRFFYTYYLIHYYRDLLPTLIEQGWRVEVVISRAEYRPGFELPFHPEVSVICTPTLGFKPNSMFGKLMVMATYILFGGLFSLFGPSVDKNVFFTQPPLLSSLWGYLLNKMRRQRNLQILQDIFPDIAIETGHLKRSSFLARGLINFSRFALSRADYIGVIGRCMEEKLINEGIPTSKIVLLPNWANADLINPLPHKTNLFRLQQGWQDRFVLAFAGNIGIPQYFDDILEICRRFNKEYPDFLMAFIGSGSYIATIHEYRRRYKLENITMISFQPLEKQTEFLSAADVHFVSLKAGIEGLAVPSKSYSIMAAGRPIIYQGNPNGEVARLVREHNIGVAVPLNNPDLLEQAILNYMNDERLRREHSDNARHIAETACGYRTAIQRLISLLQR